MSKIDKQALREAANAANSASWGNWEPYKPHKGARGYEVKVGVKAVAQHCLKVDSVFIAAANPVTVLALLDELEAAEKTSTARLEALDRTHKMYQREKERAEKAEKRIAEYRELISGLVGVSSSILREVERINNAAAAGKGE
ncbi:TPA: ead/Ea22-like family protein [Enterobacter hormaechei subsp. steigerwaltii]|nr:ead/Ea22-like family protein [Enterobacter hormaechei subsp. steigerwaltii]